MFSLALPSYFYGMKKVLVIEDNIAIRENTAELLVLGGFDVMTAKNGTEGYNMAIKALPDVILCDMMMPETDGRGFLNLARANPVLRSTPIIFFSAGTVSPKEHSYLLSRSSGFLRKPFQAEDLLKAIHVALQTSEHP